MVDGTAERISALGECRTAPQTFVYEPTWDDCSIGGADALAHLRALDLVYSGVVKDHRSAVVEVDRVAEDLLPELFSRCVRMNQWNCSRERRCPSTLIQAGAEQRGRCRRSDGSRTQDNGQDDRSVQPRRQARLSGHGNPARHRRSLVQRQLSPATEPWSEAQTPTYETASRACRDLERDLQEAITKGRAGRVSVVGPAVCVSGAGSPVQGRGRLAVSR